MVWDILIHLLEKDWSKARIQILPDILQQTGLAKLDRVLNEFEIVGVRVLQLKQNFVTTLLS